jgi:streptogramin lyase
MRHRSLLLVVVLFLWLPTEAVAAAIMPGDILVADPADGFLGLPSGSILRVDPLTGSQTIFATADGSFRPVDIAIAGNGDLLILNKGQGSPGGGRGVLRADPVTGELTPISLFGLASLAVPTGMAIAPNGDIFVTTFDPLFGGLPNVLRVDPVTGIPTVLSEGGSFVTPSDLVVDANGDILVVDSSAFGPGTFGTGGIIRVDPLTGAQTTLAAGGSFADPDSLVIDANGDILVANFDATSNFANDVVRVDPATGVQTILSAFPPIVQAHGIALGPNGEIWIAGSLVGGPGVARVDPLTGAQERFSNGGFFRNPAGIAIVPSPLPSPATEPATLVLLGFGLAGVLGLGRKKRIAQ